MSGPIAILGRSRRIDALIDQQFREAGVPAAPLADDAEFFRRLSLDLNGRILLINSLHGGVHYP